MPDYSKIIDANQQRWDTAVFKPQMQAKAAKVAARLAAPKAKSIYQAIEEATGVPWFAIAVIHEREASQKWDRHLGQGDPLNKKTTHVPKGRGPFTGPNAFYNGAIDALKNCSPYAARWKDWTAGGTLTILELYNGLGYEGKIASPYIWSGSQHYKIGKIIKDHGPIEQVVDTQLGCAIMLSEMQKLDDSIDFANTDAPVGILSVSAQAEEEINPDEFPVPAGVAAEEPDVPPPEPPPPQAATAQRVDRSIQDIGREIANSDLGRQAVPLAKSKIAWVSTALGGTTAAGTIAAAPETRSLFVQLISQPAFWLALVCVILSGYVVYLRWREHGRGSLQ